MTDILTFIFNLLLAIVFYLVKLILLPIDTLLSTVLPDVSTAFTQFANFLSLILTGLGYAFSLTGLPVSVLTLVTAYWIFKLTYPLNVWFIKLAIKWYKAIKL